MKRCPECGRDYYNDTLLYCLDDGNALLEGPASVTYAPLAGEEPTRRLIPSDWERIIRAETHPADREFDRRYENLAPLIGRREELAAIKELLTGASERLVTLTGIGGTGKTRLSIEVARHVKSNFPDGVFFVELSRITDADLVIPTIAQSIGIESRHRDVVDSLGRYLRERSVLLVVDNMEQVVSAGVQLAELVRQSSNVKILVTSRAPLGLSVETEYRLSPLALPNQQPGLSISELMDCESVQLFVARAKQAWREFELTEDNAEVVAAICRKLDGLPLALELAAARAKVLSPSEILERLENSLALLTGGSQDLPGRQQTIRAAVEWSYDLLDAVEQTAFWRLSVFEGSFTLGQAEKVIADSKIVEAEILDVVTSLSEKSLLASVRTGQPEIRFRMLQLVRDFALEILTREDGDGSIRGAHARYFLELAQQASEHLETSDSAEWLARLESNHDNLRAAIRWSLSDDIETAARLMAALRNFLIIRGHIRQGRQWFEEVLTKETGLSSDLRWELLTGLGNMSQFQGDYPRAREAYANSLDEARAANDQKKIARSLRGLGAVDYIQRDFPSARERIVEALDISRSLDDDFGIAASLSRLGDIAVAEGNMEEGRLPIIESLGLFRKLGNKMGIMAKLNNLATAELLLGNTENARTRLVESLSISRELGDRMNSRTALEGWAAIMFASGEFRKSALFCGAGAALGEMMGIELEPVEQRLLDFYFDPLRDEMGESHFSEVFAEGRKMTADAAIGLALKFEDNPE